MAQSEIKLARARRELAEKKEAEWKAEAEMARAKEAALEAPRDHRRKVVLGTGLMIEAQTDARLSALIERIIGGLKANPQAKSDLEAFDGWKVPRPAATPKLEATTASPTHHTVEIEGQNHPGDHHGG